MPEVVCVLSPALAIADSPGNLPVLNISSDLEIHRGTVQGLECRVSCSIDVIQGALWVRLYTASIIMGEAQQCCLRERRSLMET